MKFLALIAVYVAALVVAAWGGAFDHFVHPAEAAPVPTIHSWADALEIVLTTVWNEELGKTRHFEKMECKTAGKMMTFNVWSCTARLVNSNDHSSKRFDFVTTGYGEILKFRWS